MFKPIVAFSDTFEEVTSVPIGVFQETIQKNSYL